MTGSPKQSPFVTVRRDTDAYRCTYSALEPLNIPDLSGKKVLVKPNAGRNVAAGTGVVTHPDVVAAVCDFLQKRGGEIAIGEGTIVGEKPLPCLETSGIADVARKRHIPLIDLDAAAPNVRAIPNGHILSELKVSSAMKEYDYIVSVPVMKTHMHCRVSLSLKNMKGCLRGREKVRLHQLSPPKNAGRQKTLDIAISDLATILQPHLAVIDGTFAQEGLGPSGGEIKKCDLIVASTDFLSADAVAATLMGFVPEEIPHIALSAKRLNGCISCDTITIDPPEWKSYVTPFEKPPQKLSIEFPNVTVLDKDSCSACVSTLLLFLKRYYAELGDYLPLTIAIGKGHDALPDGTLCIGNCTTCAMKKEKDTYVKGCPPVASEIVKKIREEMTRT